MNSNNFEAIDNAAQPTPSELMSDLRTAYLKHVDTTFWLENESLMRERRALLENGSQLFSEIYLEPVLPYEGTESFEAICRDLNLDSGLLLPVVRALMPWFEETPIEDIKFRQHQAEAIRSSFKKGVSAGRNPVITSGTGSGKTESFWLPILFRLATEAKTWKRPAPGLNYWWRGPSPEWKSLRVSEARPAAIRAIVLYPTNALVEDQITRLRKAITNLKEVLGEQTIWFGRYTGITLGSGARSKSSSNFAKVVSQLKSYENDFSGVQKLNLPAKEKSELLAQFGHADSGEMLCRWDMEVASPDILITNFSMLNVMLMRDREDVMFSQTAEWLAESVENVVTLVVDELHLQRGTQGSEVAMIIRNLTSRLGLHSNSPQLRIIATSASMNADEGSLDFLSSFFGVERDSFHVTAGRPLEVNQTAFETDIDMHDANNADAISEAIAAACWNSDEGRYRATSMSEISKKIFSQSATPDEDLERAAKALVLGETKVPIRAHIFARTLRGLWACSNPRCTGVSAADREGRTVGKLYISPQLACDACGCRVLDLLYPGVSGVGLQGDSG